MAHLYLTFKKKLVFQSFYILGSTRTCCVRLLLPWSFSIRFYQTVFFQNKTLCSFFTYLTSCVGFSVFDVQTCQREQRWRDLPKAAQYSLVCAVETLAAKLSVPSRLYNRKSLPCQQHHSPLRETGRPASIDKQIAARETN